MPALRDLRGRPAVMAFHQADLGRDSADDVNPVADGTLNTLENLSYRRR